MGCACPFHEVSSSNLLREVGLNEWSGAVVVEAKDGSDYDEDSTSTDIGGGDDELACFAEFDTEFDEYEDEDAAAPLWA